MAGIQGSRFLPSAAQIWSRLGCPPTPRCHRPVVPLRKRRSFGLPIELRHAVGALLLADREVALTLVVLPGARDLPFFKLAVDQVVIGGATAAAAVGFKVDDSGFLVEDP